MIISRRQYEQDLERAYSRGRDDEREYYYQQDRERRIHERMDDLEEMIRKNRRPTESSSCENGTCAQVPRPF